ncbi:MAG: hypothetical protein LBS72_06485 [Oscillospiraceae bacterium]|jgi:hypothetical protein|nr:hypothetical protein [Oscillospiraceae bacterium]
MPVDFDTIIANIHPKVLSLSRANSQDVRDVLELLREVDAHIQIMRSCAPRPHPDYMQSLPGAFDGIDIYDEDDVFEAVVETIAERRCLDDEATARIGVLVAAILEIMEKSK